MRKLNRQQVEEITQLAIQTNIYPNLSNVDLSEADLTGANLGWADLTGAKLTGTNLGRANLSGANLSGADLSGADLSMANLSGTDLSEADLNRANLSGTNLNMADLSRADLSRTNLSGFDLTRAKLTGANLGWADLTEANLGWADLTGANLYRTDLCKADMYWANLNRAKLINAIIDNSTKIEEKWLLVWKLVTQRGQNKDLKGTDLSGADLSEAYLSEADLSGADLSGADLSGADLSGTSLIWTDLSQANLNRANLNGANLNGANLNGANLNEANLNGANLNDANLNDANLNGTIINETTKIEKKWLLVWELVTEGGQNKDLTGADLSWANLSWVDLKGADLSWANLSNANLIGADLSETNLCGTDLSKANLCEADLSGVDISLINLKNIDLSTANLSGNKTDYITRLNNYNQYLIETKNRSSYTMCVAPLTINGEKLRVDAAVPNEVQVNQLFDLAVAIRHASSPILNETDLPQVKSGDVYITWPQEERYVRLQIEIKSPNCELQDEYKRMVRLYLHEDSPVFYFQLAPKQTGKITIMIFVYQQDDLTGSARVQTVAHQLAGQVEMTITSQPMIHQGLPPTLYSQLQETFLNSGNFDSDNELKAIFVDQRIHPWQYQIPQVNSSADRVSQIIHYLYTQYRGDTGENALALFTQVLSQQHDPATLCHVQLTQLANELEHKLSKKSLA